MSKYWEAEADCVRFSSSKVQRSKRETPKFADRDALKRRLMAARFTMRPAMTRSDFSRHGYCREKTNYSEAGYKGI